jgi:hypothetical protein
MPIPSPVSALQPDSWTEFFFEPFSPSRPASLLVNPSLSEGVFPQSFDTI